MRIVETFAFLIIILFGMFALGCKKTQTPLLVIQENEIQAFLSASGASDFIKDQEGYYYRIDKMGQGSKFSDADVLIYSMTINSLDSQNNYFTRSFYDGYYQRIFFADFGGDNDSRIRKTLRSAFQKINTGGKLSLLVPSHLAFGKEGNGDIPSNEVVKIEAETTNFTTEQEIEKNLITTIINAVPTTYTYDPLGFFYKISNQGDQNRLKPQQRFNAFIIARLVNRISSDNFNTSEAIYISTVQTETIVSSNLDPIQLAAFQKVGNNGVMEAIFPANPYGKFNLINGLGVGNTPNPIAIHYLLTITQIFY